MPDYHLHDQLLVFHPSAALHGDSLVRSRRVLIQDKASCIPAAVLDPDTDMDVIDACAAPGNKTSHLLAILSEKWTNRQSDAAHTPTTLFAFDRDETRFRSLQAAMAPYGAPHPISEGVTVDAQLTDFTKVDPTDERYSNVGYICLDPSCSGSGIMRQVDRVAERAGSGRVDQGRLKSLQNFQAMLLSHALSFPSVKRVVYSTCSVTMEENESVVEEIMDKWGSEFALHPIWMDSWMTRGKKAAFKNCVRTNPTYDLCNGFFVACFERIAPAGPAGTFEARRRGPKLACQSFIKRDEEVAVAAKKYRTRRKTKKTGKKAKEHALKSGKEGGAAQAKDGTVAVKKDKKRAKKDEAQKTVADTGAAVKSEKDNAVQQPISADTVVAKKEKSSKKKVKEDASAEVTVDQPSRKRDKPAESSAADVAVSVAEPSKKKSKKSKKKE